MSVDTELINNLAKTRALNYDLNMALELVNKTNERLFLSQKRMADAIDCALEVIRVDANLAKDQRFETLRTLFDEAIDLQVKPS